MMDMAVAKKIIQRRGSVPETVPILLDMEPNVQQLTG
jgi:hypothetical protein